MNAKMPQQPPQSIGKTVIPPPPPPSPAHRVITRLRELTEELEGLNRAMTLTAGQAEQAGKLLEDFYSTSMSAREWMFGAYGLLSAIVESNKQQPVNADVSPPHSLTPDQVDHARRLINEERARWHHDTWIHSACRLLREIVGGE